MYIPETRTKDKVPRTMKNLDQFFKEQNGILAGIIKACRQIPEPLEEEVEDEEQEELEAAEPEYEIEEIESEESDLSEIEEIF